MPGVEPRPIPQVDDLVIIVGRVHALPHAEGALFPVETAMGGFVWLMPDECEQFPAAEVAGGLE